MNKKGFILSTYVYLVLVFFLLILASTLMILNSTKLLSNKLKQQNKKDYNFIIKGDLEMEIEQGKEFVDPGVIATEYTGKELVVSTSGKVDTSNLGDYQVTYTINYKGKNISLTRNVKVKEKIPNFETDTWDEILEVIERARAADTPEEKENILRNYHVGDEKTIVIGAHTNDCSRSETHVCQQIEVSEPKSYTVRIANKTLCDGTLESETACGFVIEFADIIERHVMNNSSETSVEGTNLGSFPGSDLKKYLSDVLYPALDVKIQNAIIDTKVISGHGTGANKNTERADGNYESTEKLYLLSPMEVYGEVLYDSAGTTNFTRQLDWYKNLGVTSLNHSAVMKMEKDTSEYSWWWLRAPSSNRLYGFKDVNNDGSDDSHYSKYSGGISPAFRLA